MGTMCTGPCISNRGMKIGDSVTVKDTGASGVVTRINGEAVQVG